MKRSVAYCPYAVPRPTACSHANIESAGTSATNAFRMLATEYTRMEPNSICRRPSRSASTPHTMPPSTSPVVCRMLSSMTPESRRILSASRSLARSMAAASVKRVRESMSACAAEICVARMSFRLRTRTSAKSSRSKMSTK